MNNGSLIEMKGVSKYYDGKVCVLDSIDLSIKRGEWVSIMGPSGSGKTTLLNIVSCLDRPCHGRIINGEEGQRTALLNVACHLEPLA